MYALAIIRYRRPLDPFVKENLVQYELLPWNVMGGRGDLDKI